MALIGARFAVLSSLEVAHSRRAMAARQQKSTWSIGVRRGRGHRQCMDYAKMSRKANSMNSA